MEPRPARATDSFSPEALEEILGRRLIRDERRFLTRLETVYQRYRRGEITMWDLELIGYSCYYTSYLSLGDILPVTAATKAEFWAWIAHSILKQRRQLPEFIQPITDFALIAKSLAELERRRSIQKWTRLLESLSTDPTDESQIEYDFRLRFCLEQPVLEWSTGAPSNFQPLRRREGKELARRFLLGKLRIIPQALPLWDALARRFDADYSFRLDYSDAPLQSLLNALLRMPGTQERIVTHEGQAFLRPEETLRWEVRTSEGDYHMQMVLSDGTRPPQPWILALDGRPALYITTQAIYCGPPLTEVGALDKHVIPAPALETEHGVQFLLSVQAPLPPSIEERVERLPLEATFHCGIAPTYPGSTTEELAVRIRAQTADGRAPQYYDDGAWTVPSQCGKTKKGRIPILDRSGLAAVPGLVEALSLKWDWSSKRWRGRIGKNFPDKFAAWLSTIPPHIRVELDALLKTLAANPVAGTVKLDCVETDVDWFDLRVCLDVSEAELTPEEIKLLLDARGKFVRLKNKGWRRLEYNVSADEDERLARLGLSVAEFSSEPQRLHALQLADEAAARLLPQERVEQIRRRVTEIKTRVTPAVPPEIQATLRPYQIEGFHFLAYLTANRFGGILADDMGLGKTLQTLAWLLWARALAGQKPAPTLVVCPKSVMETWRSETARFAPVLKVTLWRGTDLEAFNAAVAEADLIVLNYAQLRGMADALTRVRWMAAILDEGQYIKNPDSQTAQLARALQAQYRLALSGTPIENRLMDLWSLMAFAMPGVLGQRAQFGRQFNIATDPLARRRLAARVRPFLLRRTKGQVAADLPDRTEEDLICEMDGDQKALYRAEFKHAQQMLLKVKTHEDLNEFRFHFLTSLLRLRQICCHPALVNEKFESAESAKLSACLELLEPLVEEGHKVLVFSQFVTMLDILRRAVKDRKWRHFYLAGNTENRGELVDEFQKAPGHGVFLISLKAGGFGLNLTAASYVVLFDPWWNPAVENQAIDRTHRIGQTRKVIAYRILIKDSIEEKIRQLQRKKSALAEDILGEENFAQSLTLNDLRFLFAGD